MSAASKPPPEVIAAARTLLTWCRSEHADPFEQYVWTRPALLAAELDHFLEVFDREAHPAPLDDT